MPPRYPRRLRAPISCAESAASRLEVEEYTGGASPAVICGFLMLLDVEVHSPVGADPLPPGSRDVVHGEVKEDVVGGNLDAGSADEFVSFAPTRSGEKRNVLYRDPAWRQ